MPRTSAMLLEQAGGEAEANRKAIELEEAKAAQEKCYEERVHKKVEAKMAEFEENLKMSDEVEQRVSARVTLKLSQEAKDKAQKEKEADDIDLLSTFGEANALAQALGDHGNRLGSRSQSSSQVLSPGAVTETRGLPPSPTHAPASLPHISCC